MYIPTGSLAELSSILGELKSLLDRNNFDEGWSDWLNEFAKTTFQVTAKAERAHLLLQLQQGETSLYQLGAYLPEHSPDGALPRQELDQLICILDSIVGHGLEDLKWDPGVQVNKC
jgi:hypothetical protein